MDELKEMTLKLVEYHNKIVETSNNEGIISDEFATEVSNYLSNDVPPLLLNADKTEAFACISAICKGFPTPFLCNILTALVLYIFQHDLIKDKKGDIPEWFKEQNPDLFNEEKSNEE